MFEFKKAAINDFEFVRNFYIELIEKTPDFEKYTRWIYGKHPTDEMVRNYIANGEMYSLMQGEKAAGVVAVTMYQGKDYEAVNWKRNLKSSEVSVLHILGIHPDFQGKGISKALIDEATEISKANGMKAVRLDTLETNLPAQHLYEKYGFDFRGRQFLFTQNAGWINFLYYEKIL